MANNRNYPIDVDGTEALSTVLLSLLNSFPGLESGKKIKFSTLAKTSGIAVFPSAGAAIIQNRESVTGHVTQSCQYLFTLVYRTAPETEKQRLRIKEFLDTIGRWLEMQPVNIRGEAVKLEAYPVLTGTRIIKSIRRTTPGHLNVAYPDGVEDWTIAATLSYENEYDK